MTKGKSVLGTAKTLTYKDINLTKEKQANPAKHTLPPQFQGKQQTSAVSHTIWLCVQGWESLPDARDKQGEGGEVALVWLGSAETSRHPLCSI